MTLTSVEAPAAAKAPPDRDRLDQQLASGLAWTGAVKTLVQAVSWIATLAVARILSPADYGLVGMASAYLGLVALVTEFGIGAAVVNMRRLSSDQLNQLNGLAMLLGWASLAISCLAAYPLSVFFSAPELMLIVPVMSSTFVINSARTIPAALLHREMKFRLVAILEGTQAIIMSLIMVALALAGLRYWTLVIGAVAGALITTVLMLYHARVGIARPRRAQIREAAAYSWNIVTGRLAWYTYSNADFLIAGRMLGKSALGAYGFAWQLASMPVEKITTLVMRVAPAVFSEVQTDAASMRRYMLMLTEGLATITFPATIGLALVAEDLVAVLLGPSWAAAAGPLRFLALYAAVRSVTPLLSLVLYAVGQSRYARNNSIAAAVVLPAAFIVGAGWGASGIALAWMIAHPLVLLPLLVRACSAIQLRPIDYLRTFKVPLTATAAMACAVLAAGEAGLYWPTALRLVNQVAIGVVAYLAAYHYLSREGIRRILRFIRQARGWSVSAPEATQAAPTALD